MLPNYVINHNNKTSTKGNMDLGVHATAVTAGYYTYAELTNGMLWLAVTAVACTPAVHAN